MRLTNRVKDIIDSIPNEDYHADIYTNGDSYVKREKTLGEFSEKYSIDIDISVEVDIFMNGILEYAYTDFDEVGREITFKNLYDADGNEITLTNNEIFTLEKHLKKEMVFEFF